MMYVPHRSRWLAYHTSMNTTHGGDATELAALIRQQPTGGCRAWTPALRPLSVTAKTREQAIVGLRSLIADVRPDASLALIDVAGTQLNPWLETAGVFANDPTWDEFMAEIHAARAREDGQGDVAMQFTIILKPQPDGAVRATVPAIPGLTVSGGDRERALDLARLAIADALDSGEVAVIDVPAVVRNTQNSWVATAGIFKDDPTWDEFMAEIKAARAREDAAMLDSV